MINIFTDKYKKYQGEFVFHDVHVEPHNEYLRISPTGTNKIHEIGNLKINRQEIYSALNEAKYEARIKFLNKPHLFLGLDTHNIQFHIDYQTHKIEVILDVENPPIVLEAFKELKKKYNIGLFSLGYVPFHSNDLLKAMTEVVNNYKYAKIRSIFKQKQTKLIRAYIGIGFNPLSFGIKKSDDIEL